MKEFIKRNIKSIILVIVCMIGSFISSAFATNGLFDSKQVDYDNSNSHITSTNVGDAIDEVFQHATDYNEIKTTIGDNTLTTTNQTLTGGINELNEKITYQVFVETDTYHFDGNGEAVIQKSGCIPIAVVEPEVWAGFTLDYFAYTINRASIKKSAYANSNHTLSVVFVRYS